MSDFPPIKDELRQAAKTRLDVNLKPRPELPDEAIAANSRVIGERYGSATSLPPPAPLRNGLPPKAFLQKAE